MTIYEPNRFEAFLQKLGVNFETRCTYWNDDSFSVEPYQLVVIWYAPQRLLRLWREMPNAPDRVELANVFGATIPQATARATDQPALRAALDHPERICGWRYNADADRYDAVLSPVPVESSS